MKLRSGGLLFREKGSMNDFRNSGEAHTIAVACSHTRFGSILEGIFDQKSIKSNPKTDRKLTTDQSIGSLQSAPSIFLAP